MEFRRLDKSKITRHYSEVLIRANSEARELYHEWVATEHLLLGMLNHADNNGYKVLSELEAPISKIKDDIFKLSQRGPEKAILGKLPYTPRSYKVLTYSIEEAERFSNELIGTEHLLLGHLREGEGVAAMVLMQNGVLLDKVRDLVSKIEEIHS